MDLTIILVAVLLLAFLRPWSRTIVKLLSLTSYLTSSPLWGLFWSPSAWRPANPLQPNRDAVFEGGGSGRTYCLSGAQRSASRIRPQPPAPSASLRWRCAWSLVPWDGRPSVSAGFGPGPDVLLSELTFRP